MDVGLCLGATALAGCILGLAHAIKNRPYKKAAKQGLNRAASSFACPGWTACPHWREWQRLARIEMAARAWNLASREYNRLTWEPHSPAIDPDAWEQSLDNAKDNLDAARAALRDALEGTL